MSLRYDIYGNILTPLSQEDKTFSYNTQEYTPQNRLYYIKARYYDSSTGSFISKDTYLGNIYKPTTTNRYAYCSGDPVNYMDLDGHIADRGGGIGNKKGGSSKIVPWTPVGDINDWPSNKPSSGGKKPSNTPSGAYTSDGFDGGSSYHYVPPPPNPRQYYRSLVIGPYVYNTNSHDYISNQLNKKQSIKELVTSNSGGYGAGNYSMLYASTAINLSKAQTEMVSNNVNTDSLHKAASIAIVLKPYLIYSLTISALFPPAKPFIIGANALADTLIITSGLDNIQKAVADDDQTTYECVEKVAIGIVEMAYGCAGLFDTLAYLDEIATAQTDTINTSDKTHEFNIDIENNKATYPGDDPTRPPGKDWEWKGGENGSWYNPNTDESLHPDLNHPEGIEKHWDYQIRGEDNSKFRIFQDGHIEKK